MAYTVVQFTTHGSDGDTVYRRTWPMQALGKLPDFRVIDIHYMHPYRYRLAFDADLLILGMMGDADIVPILRWRKAKGKPCIYEVNNHISFIAPWNPAFDIWSKPVSLVDNLQMIALADLVQTSSPFLAEELRPYCSSPVHSETERSRARIVVLPNQLARTPAAIPMKSPPYGGLVVGWGGSLSHAVDMAVIAPAVSRWINERPDVVLSIMGNEAISNLFTVVPAKKRTLPWGTIETYEKFLDDIHIGLAPLQDNPFNRARSDVKWLEYAAHGCVFVGQRIPPYSDTVEDGKTGFLFDDEAQLIHILDRLYEKRELLESVRRAAFDHVSKNRQYDGHAGEWADVYRELLAQKPPKGGEQWDLDRKSSFPRPVLPDSPTGYLPINLDPDENKAFSELHSDRTPASDAALALVEGRYGEFHLTAYARGLRACVRGDLASAEGLLQRARAFYPAGVPALVLLGRVLLTLGRLPEAQEMLNRAAKWNPIYGPTYRNLLVALEEQSRWETAISVTEEWERDFNGDPYARIHRGAILIRSGREQDGMDVILDVMNRIKERWGFWQLRFAAELVHVLRRMDVLMGKDARWQDLIVKAAQMFPYGMWLAVRAGAICFQRGDHDLGAGILHSARERLLEWEWQNVETGEPPQHRGLIEIYRTACEELAGQSRRPSQ